MIFQDADVYGYADVYSQRRLLIPRSVTKVFTCLRHKAYVRTVRRLLAVPLLRKLMINGDAIK